MIYGFTAPLNMSFLDSSKAILAKVGWEHFSLWTSLGLCFKYILCFPLISNSSQTNDEMLQ